MLQFNIVTEEDFPYGLRCSICSQVIEVGQPYSEVPSGFIGEDVLVELVCVYCGGDE